MMRLRFSLVGLAGMVALAALSCAALVNASPWIASIAWTIVVLLLVFGSIAAVLSVSARRPFWIGFALAGWLYALVTTGALGGQNGSTMLTARLLHLAAAAMPQAQSTAQVISGSGQYYTLSMAVPGTPSPYATSTTAPRAGRMTMAMTPQPYVATYIAPQNREFIESFTQIGQALWTLLLAFAGGLFGALLHARQRRTTELPSPSRPEKAAFETPGSH